MEEIRGGRLWLDSVGVCKCRSASDRQRSSRAGTTLLHWGPGPSSSLRDDSLWAVNAALIYENFVFLKSSKRVFLVTNYSLLTFLVSLYSLLCNSL